MINVMHFADVHFGVENYGKTDPATGLNSRLVDFRNSLNAAIDEALKRDVHLVIFAGDAYKTRDPNQTHQREFASCIRRFVERQIPVVLVAGNHDVPNAKARANAVDIYRTLPLEHVHVFSSPDIRVIDTKVGRVQVAAVPFMSKSSLLTREEYKGKTIEETTNLTVLRYGEHIRELAGKVDPEIPAILVGHFWVKNAQVGAKTHYLNVDEPEVPVAYVANSAFDYVALGHVHKFQNMHKKGNPPVVYSGSIDRIDFSERDDEKGFVFVRLERGKADYEFVPVQTRQFVQIDVKIGRESDPTSKVIKEIAKRHTEGAIVKVTIEVPLEKAPMIRDQDVRKALQDAFLVVGVSKVVTRNERAQRAKLLHEAVDPLKALEMYLLAKNVKTDRKDELLRYAEALVEEVVQEEVS